MSIKRFYCLINALLLLGGLAGSGLCHARSLADIVACSADPGWCIEFDEPVDLSAPEQEIVRQIFGNRRRWRLCWQEGLP